jgi:predicted Zn-dependent protease
LTLSRDQLVPKFAQPASTERWIPPSTPPTDLYVVAIGDVPTALLDDMVARFETKFRMRTRVLPRLLFDRTTFDRARSQRSADELILAIRRRYATIAANRRARVIGVTRGDMYMEGVAKQWLFTFSLRSEDNHVAVVSYARMDPAALGEPPDDARLAARLRKMVATNIGVICYGLPLSRNPRSVLYGQIGGVDDLDRMTESFDPE